MFNNDTTSRVERILATYIPVDDTPGYVWFSKTNQTYVKLDVLREVYEEYLSNKSGYELGGYESNEFNEDFNSD